MQAKKDALTRDFTDNAPAAGVLLGQLSSLAHPRFEVELVDPAKLTANDSRRIVAAHILDLFVKEVDGCTALTDLDTFEETEARLAQSERRAAGEAYGKSLPIATGGMIGVGRRTHSSLRLLDSQITAKSAASSSSDNSSDATKIL